MPRGNERSLGDIRGGLSRALEGFSENDFLTIEVTDRDRYVQFLGVSQGILAEAVSNRFLDAEHQLSEEEQRQIETLGWAAPNESRPNYWRIWTSPIPFVDVVNLAVSTLCDVFGVNSPEKLAYINSSDSPQSVSQRHPSATAGSTRGKISEVGRQPDGALRCPQCGGQQFTAKRSALANTFLILTVGIFTLLAPKNQVCCVTCGTVFRRG